MRPVRVDIVTYAPTVFRHCQHCEIAFDQVGVGSRLRHIEADESLPVDLQLEYLDVSAWVRDLRERHGPAVAVRVVDAASLLGVWLSWRHGLRAYPAVVVDGEGTPAGPGDGDLDHVIDLRVADALHKGGTSS